MIVIEGDTTPELASLIAQRSPDNDPEWMSAIITDLEHRCTSSILKLMDGAGSLIDLDNNPPEGEGNWNEIAAAFMIVGMCRAELMGRIEHLVWLSPLSLHNTLHNNHLGASPDAR
jgi:hypothetical protein